MSWTPLDGDDRYQLPYFVCYLLRELGLASTPTKQQLSILDWMGNGPNSQITVGFRGVAKSTMAAFVALHRLRIDPFDEKVLLTACTADKAKEISTFMLMCIDTIDLLQCLRPHDKGRTAVDAFDVANSRVDQSPSVRAVGILSPSLTGKRCTLAIADDIETLNNSITPLKQARLADAVTELVSIPKPDEGQVLPRKVLFLGTPHLENSLYLKLNRERKYAMRYWPARYPDPQVENDWDCYGGNLDPAIAAEVLADRALVGAPTDPERFDHDELLNREIRMPKAKVMLNFQLNCRLSTLDRFPLRLGDLIVMDLNGMGLPEVVVWGSEPQHRIQDLDCIGMGADNWYHKPAVVTGWIAREQTWRCCMYVDPAGRGHDELAWAVVAELGGNLFLLESGGTQLGYDEAVLHRLGTIAKRWQINYCLVEPNMGAGMFTQLLMPVMAKHWAVTVEDDAYATQQKERRMVDTLAPLVQQHRLIVNKAVIRDGWVEAEADSELGHSSKSLMLQMSRLTLERGCLEWADRLDAVTGACKFFLDAAAQDQKVEATNRSDEIQEEMTRGWLSDDADAIDALAAGRMPVGSALRRPGLALRGATAGRR